MSRKNEKEHLHFTKEDVHCYKLFTVENILKDERKDYTEYCNNRRRKLNYIAKLQNLKAIHN